MKIIEGKHLQVLLKWKDLADFRRSHFSSIVPARNRGDVFFLDETYEYSSKLDFLFAKQSIAQGDYTPNGPIAQDPNFSFQEIEINYSPTGKIPWVKYNPLTPIVKKLGVSDAILDGIENTFQARKIRLLRPKGEPPEGGHPIVLMSHGSLAPHQPFRPEEISFLGMHAELPFGGYNEARLIHGLLESGYAVMFLDAELSMVWTTNGPLVRHLPQITTDHYFLKNLLNLINSGELEGINALQKFALGISSGGYNTSRLGNEYPDEFKAIVIQAAGQMKNLGPIFKKISKPKPNHPPTMFLHGVMDTIVPIGPALDYFNALKQSDIEAFFGIFDGGHAWNEEAPFLIPNYFDSFL